MKRLFLGVVLALTMASPVLAAPKLICSVTPVSAASGSVFTVSVTGATGNLGSEVYWSVRGYQVADDDVAPPKSGRFSISEQITFDGGGQGRVVVYSYGWSSYTTAYCYFTVN